MSRTSALAPVRCGDERVVAFLLSLVLEEVPLSEHAGMVARGEAVNSEEELAALSKPAVVDKVVILGDKDDDPREAPVHA